MTFYKKYDIIYRGEQNYERLYTYRTAVCGFSGFCRGICGFTFNRKIFHMGLTDRNSVRLVPWRPFHQVRRPYGAVQVSRSLTRPEQTFDFGKKWKKFVHKKFTGNFWKRIDFLKIPASSTIVGRTATPLLLYHTSLQKSIGKMHKKNRLTAISRFHRHHPS